MPGANQIIINPADYTIMVVDDTQANVLLLQVLLKANKYKVKTYNSGIDCLEHVKEDMPDLILLDVSMPKMNGFEVAEHLRADEETSDLPIIFLTAYDQKENMLQGFRSGGNDYITKPFEREVLIARINSQLKLAAARRQIELQNIELESTIKGRDHMYSVIAHDLRSPLGAVQMSVKMLEDLLPADVVGEDLHGMICETTKQVDEVFSLLDNLLKWTKSQTGRLHVMFQDQEAETLVIAMLDIYTSVASTKGIALKAEPSAGNTMVHCDNDMIKTILRNFISNAIKFSKEGTTITLSIKEEGDYAIIGVTDQGCGMTPEEVSRLFNKDTHFSKYGTNREEGSGLGLLLCQTFALMNGGRLDVQSTVGQGSTFSVYIPRTGTEAAAASVNHVALEDTLR